VTRIAWRGAIAGRVGVVAFGHDDWMLNNIETESKLYTRKRDGVSGAESACGCCRDGIG